MRTKVKVEEQNASLSFHGKLESFSYLESTRLTRSQVKRSAYGPRGVKVEAQSADENFKEESETTLLTEREILLLSRRKRAKDEEDDYGAYVTGSRRKRKPSRRYADPSVYAHLNTTPDLLLKNLKCIFIGLNPGVMTAIRGHHFAGPNNLFWKLVNASNVVGADRPLGYTDDEGLPARGFGMTNIIPRPTAESSELSRSEMLLAVAPLEAKIREHQSEWVCIIGKGIYEAIYRARHSGPLPCGFKFGAQHEPFGGAKVFVTPSTSGRVAAYSWDFKLALWKELQQILSASNE